jgi:hypothetical protein
LHCSCHQQTTHCPYPLFRPFLMRGADWRSNIVVLWNVFTTSSCHSHPCVNDKGCSVVMYRMGEQISRAYLSRKKWVWLRNLTPRAPWCECGAFALWDPCLPLSNCSHDFIVLSIIETVIVMRVCHQPLSTSLCTFLHWPPMSFLRYQTTPEISEFALPTLNDHAQLSFSGEYFHHLDIIP